MMNLDKAGEDYNACCNNCGKPEAKYKLTINTKTPEQVIVKSSLLFCAPCLHRLKLLILDYYQYILGE